MVKDSVWTTEMRSEYQIGGQDTTDRRRGWIVVPHRGWYSLTNKSDWVEEQRPILVCVADLA